MTVVFVGGEITSFNPNETGSGEQTQRYDGNWARCSLCTIGAPGAPTMTSPVFASVTNCWLHLDFATSPGSASILVDHMFLYDSAGVARVKIQANSTAAYLRLMYNTGAGWVQVGGNYGINHLNRQTLDLQVLCNTASGRIRLYNSGTLVLDSGTINLSAIPNIAQLQFCGSPSLSPNTDTSVFASQVIVADEATIGWKLATFVPTGNGANTAWTGAFGDVDEVAYNDGDFISTAVANDIETYTLTGPSLGASPVKAVAVTARVRNNVTGPQNLQLALRSGGTNYFSGTKSLTTGFTPEQHIWETDPATGVAWLAANVPGIEAGVKAIA